MARRGYYPRCKGKKIIEVLRKRWELALPHLSPVIIVAQAEAEVVTERGEAEVILQALKALADLHAVCDIQDVALELVAGREQTIQKQHDYIKELWALKEVVLTFMTWMHEADNPSFEEVYRMASGLDNALARVKVRGERR